MDYTYALIKLPSLSSCDKTFTIRVPCHSGQTVFMGLRHFGPQLPRLVNTEIDVGSEKAVERKWGKGDNKKKTLGKCGGRVRTRILKGNGRDGRRGEEKGQ